MCHVERFSSEGKEDAPDVGYKLFMTKGLISLSDDASPTTSCVHKVCTCYRLREGWYTSFVSSKWDNFHLGE